VEVGEWIQSECRGDHGQIDAGAQPIPEQFGLSGFAAGDLSDGVRQFIRAADRRRDGVVVGMGALTGQLLPLPPMPNDRRWPAVQQQSPLSSSLLYDPTTGTHGGQDRLAS